MNVKETKLKIIEAGHRAVEQLIKVAKEDIIKHDPEVFKKLTPQALFDLIGSHRLHFDHTSHTGIVLHMISSVSTLGKLGLTAIGDSPEHAQEIYQKFVDVLEEAAN